MRGLAKSGQGAALVEMRPEELARRRSTERFFSASNFSFALTVSARPPQHLGRLAQQDVLLAEVRPCGARVPIAVVLVHRLAERPNGQVLLPAARFAAALALEALVVCRTTR
jgi:hypothetical protein